MTALWLFLRPLLPHLGIALALAGAVLWIDHNGYSRAERKAEQRQLVDAIVAERKTRRIEQALGEAVAAIDGKVATRVDAIRVLRETIIQPMQKEISIETRYRDDACSLTPGVLRGIQQARGATATAGPDGSVTVALPAPSPAR